MSINQESPVANVTDPVAHDRFEIQKPESSSTLADEKDMKEVILGLVLLQEMTDEPTECPGEDEAPCGDYCKCHMNNIVRALFTIVLAGAEKEEAKLYLEEAFETAQGKPRTFH